MKNAVFKIAFLTLQGSELPTPNPERTIQENQQLIPEAKRAQTELDLFRGENCWSLPSLCAHSNTDAGPRFPPVPTGIPDEMESHPIESCTIVLVTRLLSAQTEFPSWAPV